MSNYGIYYHLFCKYMFFIILTIFLLIWLNVIIQNQICTKMGKWNFFFSPVVLLNCCFMGSFFGFVFMYCGKVKLSLQFLYFPLDCIVCVFQCHLLPDITPLTICLCWASLVMPCFFNVHVNGTLVVTLYTNGVQIVT